MEKYFKKENERVARRNEEAPTCGLNGNEGDSIEFREDERIGDLIDEDLRIINDIFLSGDMSEDFLAFSGEPCEEDQTT